jgi:hypothetical protein
MEIDARIVDSSTVLDFDRKVSSKWKYTESGCFVHTNDKQIHTAKAAQALQVL